MNRSYESIYLKKERQRFISNLPTVDASEVTVVPPFHRSTSPAATPPSIASVWEHSQEAALLDSYNTGRRRFSLRSGDSQTNVRGREEAPRRNSNNMSISKSVSFHESVPDPDLHDDSPFQSDVTPMSRAGPTSIVRTEKKRSRSPVRSNEFGSKVVLLRSADRKRSGSPGSRRSGSPGRNRSNSPGSRRPVGPSIQAVLADGYIISDINWTQAFQCGQSNHGHDPSRVKMLSEVLKTTPVADKGTKLNVVGAYITSINLLPGSLSKPIRTIFFSNNSVSSLKGIQQFPNVKTASFASNLIRYLHDIAPLHHLKHLEKLNLDGNVVANMPYYRQYVLSLCPSLQYLDGVRVDTTERLGADVHMRKAGTVLEQLRTNEMRASVLQNLAQLQTCHLELIQTVRGRFG